MTIIPLILALLILISIFLLYKYVVNKSKTKLLEILLDEKNKTLQDLTIKYEEAINEKIQNILTCSFFRDSLRFEKIKKVLINLTPYF